MRASAAVALPLIATLVLACEGPESNGTRADATFEAGPFHVASGEEKVLCSFVRMDNEQAVDVQRVTGRQTKGGHHLVIYTVDHPIDSEPVPCSQGGQPSWAQLF